MHYGAAVIYSGKDNANKNVVYRYLLHRAYGFSFKESADLTHAEAIFIPSGTSVFAHSTRALG